MASRKRKLSELNASAVEEKAAPVKRQKLEQKESNEKLMRNGCESNILENAYLPPEILVPIFSRLGRADLAHCSRVCQHWLNCSKDPVLGWWLCEEFSLYLSGFIGYMNSGVQTYPDKEPFSIVCRERPDSFLGRNCVLFDVKDASNATIGTTLSTPKCLTAYPDSTSDPKLWRFEIKQSFSNNLPNWDVSMELNIRQMENQIQLGRQIPEMPYIVNMVENDIVEFIDKKTKSFDCKGTIIPVPDQKGEQPKGFNNKIKLHDYQQKAIGWMKSIENNNSKEFEYCYLAPWIKGKSDLLFNLERRFAVSPDKFLKYVRKFKTNGAILADEMGLGKTIEIIGLILANPVGTLPETKKYFPTKATLIVCPNHLTSQWIDEVNKSTSPKLKAILLTTMKEVKEVTYGDILDADVVVVSMHLLKNPTYFGLGAPGGKASMGQDGPQKRALGLADKFESISKKKNYASTTQPILDYFHWHRLIVDEGHEVLKDNFVAGIIRHYSRTFSWYVTGTPFPDPELLETVKVFLGAKTEPGDSSKPAGCYSNWIENDLIVQNLLWRNTKAGTTEFSVPDYNEEIVLLDFSPIEAVLYDDLKTDSSSWNAKENLQQLCCKLPEHVGKTLTLIRDNKLEEKRQLHLSLNGRILACQSSIDYQREILEQSKLEEANSNNNGLILETPEQLEQRLKDYERAMELTKATERRNQDLFHRYAAAGVLTNNNTTNLKLDQKDEGSNEAQRVNEEKTVTFGRGSERRSKKNAAADIKKNVLAEVKKKRTPAEEKEHLIDTRGTKLTHLITYLRDLFAKNKKARVIIFSKFVPYLEEISDFLESYGIESAFVEGNIFRKNKALKGFKAADSKIKVILLSLEKAASGTNLVEASHVILMDPMSGSKSEVQAYESQAIGRAHRQGQKDEVTVVRLIIRDTIEHEMYLKAKETETGVSQGVTAVQTTHGLVRTSSLGAMVANMPQLRQSGSVANLLEKTTEN